MIWDSASKTMCVQTVMLIWWHGWEKAMTEWPWEIVPDALYPGDWRVERIGPDGECLVTIFGGPWAEKRARDYHEWVGQRNIVPELEYGDVV